MPITRKEQGCVRVSPGGGSPQSRRQKERVRLTGAAGPEAADSSKERKPHIAAGRERRAQGCFDSNLASD